MPMMYRLVAQVGGIAVFWPLRPGWDGATVAIGASTCRIATAVSVELVAWIADQAWMTGDGPKALTAGAVAWLLTCCPATGCHDSGAAGH